MVCGMRLYHLLMGKVFSMKERMVIKCLSLVCMAHLALLCLWMSGGVSLTLQPLLQMADLGLHGA